MIPCAPLFLVPACVGAVANPEVLSAAWIRIGFAIIAGTAATLLVAGWTVQAA